MLPREHSNTKRKATFNTDSILVSREPKANDAARVHISDLSQFEKRPVYHKKARNDQIGLLQMHGKKKRNMYRHHRVIDLSAQLDHLRNDVGKRSTELTYLLEPTGDSAAIGISALSVKEEATQLLWLAVRLVRFFLIK